MWHIICSICYGEWDQETFLKKSEFKDFESCLSFLWDFFSNFLISDELTRFKYTRNCSFIESSFSKAFQNGISASYVFTLMQFVKQSMGKFCCSNQANQTAKWSNDFADQAWFCCLIADQKKLISKGIHIRFKTWEQPATWPWINRSR